MRFRIIAGPGDGPAAAREEGLALTLKGKVLVANGDRQSRQQLADAAVASGYEADVSASFESGLRRLQRKAYDAILLDLGERRAGPADLVGRLLRVKPDAAVVLIAGQGPAESSTAALRKGAYAVLAKPVDPATLKGVLRNCVERRRLLAKNAELEQQTLRDDLTTAFNRRYMEIHLSEEVERARRYGHSFSMLFLDLDHLKSVNDRYGHTCGSQVLREIAQLIAKHLRKSDKIFRFGGDEFVVTLPETETDGALRVAHRLRRAVKSFQFLAEQGLDVTLTASFGVATFPKDGTTTEDLLRRADEAMYRVKDTKRDGIAVGGKVQ